MDRRRRRSRTAPLLHRHGPAMDQAGRARGAQGEVNRPRRTQGPQDLVRVSDLDDVFGVAAHEAHVRKIRATARPFTVEQKVALRQVFLARLLEREAKRKKARVGDASGWLSPRGVSPVDSASSRSQVVNPARDRAIPSPEVRPSIRWSRRAKLGRLARARPAAAPSPCQGRWSAGDRR